ncbi:nucleotidyltransferase domain-containing protein [Streptomyces caniscabiei]|uniref:Nucleotidyltransferase domain-containing protein n=1 Tax=Streptomyces caniscabiei TaxID=2746961 RepID=A0A927LCB9_9ACTN|nr:nucleotidyltransferase domain-containing protein [Streptomyces caniscabiei]MBD9729108.1 nucleotidyltransferase domain-containing protein [Streptomyces caniscabiei]MDX3514643.1 nucleotidyltransferase domain-containing protein [Streptomyces caniscabiei]MDX3723919.1 nucleotidyltransferase domain-containing protein [Streptomyces caniscabiei]WEO23853.1 nucleotidyltransferase domain-containing protein [Streptomyces caniscabiei]
MNATLENTFELFARSISLSQHQLDVALERAKEICQFLSQDTAVQECKITGSMARSTAIQKYSDVDIVVTLNKPSPTTTTPESLTSSLLNILKPTYQEAGISENTVRISFNRGPEVDVIPAIPDATNPTGGPTYKIPSADRTEWNTYAPEERNQNINRKGELLGNNFTQLIKIVKWWSKEHGQPIASYEIENIASSAFPCQMPSITRAIVEFFENAESSSTKRQRSHSALISEARIIANRALQCEQQGDTRGALNHWRILLGDQFAGVVSRNHRTG